MGKGIDFVKTILKTAIEKKGFDQCLKNFNVVSAGNGNCKVEFTVAEEHLNAGGTLHGGFTSTLVDCISTYALMTRGDVAPGVSVDLHVSFMKAAFPGDVVIVDAKTIRAGRTLAFLEVELRKKDEGSVIAQGQHTKFIGQI
ncbi:acyl-coenzyme A thioesterase 13 [Cephus cinctus]|uniref:Acyl-coenzyme A thioesterase 13 n=1 Tax=Cephus cinctus TaxID=211228 RepID=A0AAJ7BH54_CEPCN|nr:acyl-coenzyme A thioesterase 13 [Cephus cinctus]